MTTLQQRIRTVRVVVPTYDDARLPHCLDALDLLEAPDGVRVEVVVVDNGSPVAPHEIVARHPGVHLLIEHRRGSYAARNAGMAAGPEADVLAFTDSDCRPCPQWLSAALARLDAEPDVAAVAGPVQLEFTDGSPTRACEWWEALEAFPQERYVGAGYGVTANLVVRGAVAAGVGGFDAGALSGGDVDFGARLAAGGHRLVYEPRSVVRHPARARWSELLGKARRTARGSTLLALREGRDLAGSARAAQWHLRMLVRTTRRACLDPALPHLAARAGYLRAGLAVRVVALAQSLLTELGHRVGMDRR